MKKPTQETQEESHITVDFEQKYGLGLDSYDWKKQTFFIHSFWSLCIADPFPDESTVIDSENHFVGGDEEFTLEDHVYPEDR